MLEVTSDDTPDGHDDGHSVLLVRRHRYTGTAVVLPVLDTRAGPAVPADRHRIGRWRIEEDHQLSKQVAGLDAGQVIRWTSWHRWTAICLLAYPGAPAALVGLATPPPAPRPPSPPTLERLRRDNTMITTNYSCRNQATLSMVSRRVMPRGVPIPAAAPCQAANHVPGWSHGRHNANHARIRGDVIQLE